MRMLPGITTAGALALAAAALSAPVAAGPQPVCGGVAAISATDTPPELARHARRCIDAARYDDAMAVFLAYSAFSLFDQQRVRDETAHAVLQELGPAVFAGLPTAVVADLRAAAGGLRQPGGAPLRAACALLERIGPPAYLPEYMILRGTVPLKSDDDWRTPDFDADAAWKRSLHEINPCPRD